MSSTTSPYPHHLYRTLRNSPSKQNVKTETPSPSRSPAPPSPPHANNSFLYSAPHGASSLAQGTLRLPSSQQQQQLYAKQSFIPGSQSGNEYGNSPGILGHPSAILSPIKHPLPQQQLQSQAPQQSQQQPQSTLATVPNASSSQFWQEQIQRASISRQSGSPHHQARTVAQMSRDDMQTNNAPYLTVDPQVIKPTTIAHLKDENAISAKEENENQNPETATTNSRANSWTVLDMGGMRLRNLSADLCKYTFLTQLFLNHNKLTRLPSDISRLSQLITLDLSSNLLISLPVEIGRLTNLKELLLFDNQLTNLPPEMGTLFQLEFLGIEGNQISEIYKSMIVKEGTRTLICYLRDNCAVPSPPPERKWISVVEGAAKDDNTEAKEEVFTVFCYNILSETYANKTLYGYTPSWALAWNYRRELILKEVLNYRSDIICLQEVTVEIFKEFFTPVLSYEKYGGVYYPKTRTRTMNEEQKKKADGCAIFYKNTKYELLDQQMIDLQSLALQRNDFRATEDVFNRVMNRDNIATACLLKVRATGAKLIVTNAHVHWDPTFSDVKLVQVGVMMEELGRLADKWASLDKSSVPPTSKSVTDDEGIADPNVPLKTYANGTEIPLVICGDFNSMINSGVGIFLSSGAVDGTHPDFLGHVYGRYTKEGMHHDFNLRSSYEIASQNNDSNSADFLPFTNLTPSFTETIDYIWFAHNALQVEGVLGKVDENYLEQVVGFPNAHFPSDHLPILTELRVKERRT